MLGVGLDVAEALHDHEHVVDADACMDNKVSVQSWAQGWVNPRPFHSILQLIAQEDCSDSTMVNVSFLVRSHAPM